MEIDIINSLIAEVKKNKKYKTISDKIVLDEIKKYVDKNKLSNFSKEDIKEIRSNLHKSYSSFQTKKKKNYSIYLDELKKNPSDLNIIKKILTISISTKERLDDYVEIYKKIFEITKTPSVVVDLGCGLNPVSFHFMKLKKLNYFAYDIDENDISFINEYFKIMNKTGLNGKADIINLKNNLDISNLPNSDLILIFKVIDVLDNLNHKPSEELIKSLIKKTNFIIVSFATKTITRKKMNYPNRKWFEIMLERNNFQFKKFLTENEIFYILSKA